MLTTSMWCCTTYYFDEERIGLNLNLSDGWMSDHAASGEGIYLQTLRQEDELYISLLNMKPGP